MNFKRLARVSLITLSLSIFVPISLPITQAHASGLGGYAVVHPDGHVCGVIVATSTDPFGNGGFMPVEYMGCPAGSRIVFQSAPSESGNVAGTHGDGQNGAPLVTYEDTTRTFTVSNTPTTTASTQVTMLIKDGVVTDSSGRSFNTGTGISTNTTLTQKQYTEFVTESKRIDSADSQRLIALNESKELALQTPGVERCVTWQGYLETGTECSKAVISIIASGETSTVTSVSVKNTIIESSKNILQVDTSTAGVDSVTVTIKATNQFETATVKVDSVEFEGKSKEIVLLSQKLESSTVTISGIETALKKFDTIKNKIATKQIVLPDVKGVYEQAVSDSPVICKIKGITIVRLKKGTCEVSYTLTSMDTGNSYTAIKSVSFK
jgi:hypothetical protein